jgi:hypothetical protein
MLCILCTATAQGTRAKYGRRTPVRGTWVTGGVRSMGRPCIASSAWFTLRMPREKPRSSGAGNGVGAARRLDSGRPPVGRVWPRFCESRRRNPPGPAAAASGPVGWARRLVRRDGRSRSGRVGSDQAGPAGRWRHSGRVWSGGAPVGLPRASVCPPASPLDTTCVAVLRVLTGVGRAGGGQGLTEPGRGMLSGRADRRSRRPRELAASLCRVPLYFPPAFRLADAGRSTGTSSITKSISTKCIPSSS